MSNAKPNPEHYDLRQIISWTCVNGLPLFIASAGMRVCGYAGMRVCGYAGFGNGNRKR